MSELAKIEARKRHHRRSTHRRLMVCNEAGMWVCGSRHHTLDQLRGILQPGERVYEVSWSPEWKSGGNNGSPHAQLVFGPVNAPWPRLTRRDAWAALDMPRPAVSMTPSGVRARKATQRRRQRRLAKA